MKNIEATIRSQLQNKAKNLGNVFMEILQYYAIERFLYRLSVSKYSALFILKGALMFQVFQVQDRRTTLDIDFMAYYENEISNLVKIIKDICKINIKQEDGLTFDVDSVTGIRIKEGAEYEGVRIKFKGYLGKSMIPMQLDIAFGDVIFPKPKRIEYPTILGFPEPRLKGYPFETIVAEKFESMIKLGSINSRMKDFYDIWLTSRRFDFDGVQLTKALKKIFANRDTGFPKTKKLFNEEFYNDKSDRQVMWKSFLLKNNIVSAPEKLSIVINEMERFLVKPVQAILKGKKFNYFWNKSGQWKL